jgi:hypothetical protein
MLYANKNFYSFQKEKILIPKIKIEQMPDQQRYNKLKTESKLLMNVIKMICYRAESATASWIAPFLGKPVDEKRMVVKQIISSNADLVPDYSKKHTNGYSSFSFR